MIIEIFLALLLGVTAGTFTGLTPGVHINLVAAMLISFSSVLMHYASPISLAVFVISMSVTHTYLDNIPSIFLGAPEDATALAVLPGHRYLLRGNGLMAVKLTLIGSFGALLLSILLFPLFLFITKYGYPLIEGYIAYLLVATAVFMILRERKKVTALAVFLFSGCLGWLAFDMPNFANPLLPMLSGMFGISTLFISLQHGNRIPLQKHEPRTKLRAKIALTALLSGQFSGFVTAVLPGLSASIAAVMSLQVFRKLGDHGFMVLIGSIGTVNFVLSMGALFVLDKARNGSIVAVQQLLGEVNTVTLLIFLATALISGGIAVYLTLRIGKAFSSWISSINYQKLVLGIIVFIVGLVATISGWVGIVVLLVSTAIGLLCALSRISRTHAMGCIMVPVILYFL